MWLILIVATVVAFPTMYLLLDTPQLAGIVVLAYGAIWYGVAVTLLYRRWKASRST